MKTTTVEGSGENAGVVAEVQGLYGPFSFPERLLQQIWHRGDFDETAARTLAGQRVEIVHPGRWNRLGGPDFKEARLRIGEREVTGDVELHLRARDWTAHGHAADPAYERVILHVVLFPEQGIATRAGDGRDIPVLALLPLLHHDLEAYAADDAVERLAQHPLIRADEVLSAMTPVELRQELGGQAMRRWRQKTHFARVRVERLGWETACHHTALEILGYRFNRAPMLAVSGAFPLSHWRVARVEPTIADEAYTHQSTRWSLQGSRPANHPRARLRQYERWVASVPDWPKKLTELARSWPTPVKAVENDQATSTAEIRRKHSLTALREQIATELCGGAIGGTRLDTLICDGFIPLLAAQGAIRSEAAYDLWFHWFAGDVPERHDRLLRDLGGIGGRDWPACHGILQGLIGWMITEEQRQSVGSFPP